MPWRQIIDHPVRSVLVALLLVAAAALVVVLLRKPRLDRDWVDHLAVMPTIEMSEARFTLSPATDFAFNDNEVVSNAYASASENFADLKNVWFVVEPQPGQPYAAHTLVLFEFAEDRMIGLTIEARRHGEQKYDPVQGVFNNYELAYIWSTPKDLLTRRAVLLKKDIYVYPLSLTEQQKTDFLKATLRETIRVSQRARFYNTLTSNCTNELAKVAGVKWHYSWVLTGYAPRFLFDEGLIPGEDFASAQAQAKMDRDIRSWNGLPTADFSRQLLKKLRATSPIVQTQPAGRTP